MTLHKQYWLRTTTALTSALALSILSEKAFANPQGGQVVAGEATISEPDPNTLQIDQHSQRAVVEWDSFDIAPNETTRINQPNSQAWILNRITGAHNPTTIQGTLQANGNVAIVNPDGIIFSGGSRVDVGGLIASTADISNNNFMTQQVLNFNQPGNTSASIVNEGNINIGDYGIGAFVAPGVRNSGVITAKFGAISLASGNVYSLDLYGDGLVSLDINDEIADDVFDVATGEKMSDLVKNEGAIRANGGTVALKAATARKAVNSVINNTGVIEANTIGMRNGKIILGAQTAATKTAASAPQQVVKVSGTLRASALPKYGPVIASNPRKAGTIEVTGETIMLADAVLESVGLYGGGTILVGGDYLGGNGDPETIAQYGIQLEDRDIATATYVYADSNTTIDVSATENGDGGKAIVWSDNYTQTAASINAKGGVYSGDGGFIETSGKQVLQVTSVADASADNGKAGTWLLDPTSDIYVVAGATATLVPIGGIIQPNPTTSFVSSTVINQALNGGTDVTIQTFNGNDVGQGAIHIKDNILKTSGGDATLNLHANTGLYMTYGHIIKSTAGKLHVNVDADYDNRNGGFIDIDGGSQYAIQTNGGNVNMRAWDYRVQGRAISTLGGDVLLKHIDSNVTWMTVANAVGSDFVIDARTGDVVLDTKYSDENDHEIDRGDRIELGNYAIRGRNVTIKASEITNVGNGFSYGNSEYSYQTPSFNNDDSIGELNYRDLKMVGGAQESQIDGRVISDEEFALLNSKDVTDPGETVNESSEFEEESIFLENDEIVELFYSTLIDQAKSRLIAEGFVQIIEHLPKEFALKFFNGKFLGNKLFKKAYTKTIMKFGPELRADTAVGKDLMLDILFAVLDEIVKSELKDRYGEDTPKYLALEWGYDQAKVVAKVSSAAKYHPQYAALVAVVEQSKISLDRTKRAVAKWKQYDEAWKEAAISTGEQLNISILAKIKSQNLNNNSRLSEVASDGINSAKNTLTDYFNLPKSGSIVNSLILARLSLNQGNFDEFRDQIINARNLAKTYEGFVDNFGRNDYNVVTEKLIEGMFEGLELNLQNYS